MTSRKRKQCDKQQSPNQGIIALLDLPPKSHIVINGIHQVIKRDDFVGLSHVPSNTFHLVIVRRPDEQDANFVKNISPSVGIILFQNDSFESRPAAKLESHDNHEIEPNDMDFDAGKNCTDDDDIWIIARRYDPYTEEISSSIESVDVTTKKNLCHAVKKNSIPSNRVVPYSLFIRDTADHTQRWNGLTSYIDPSILIKRNIWHGDKVVPGCYDKGDDLDEGQNSTLSSDTKQKLQHKEKNVDGVEITYPPIPCINIPTDNAKSKQKSTQRRLFFRTQHLGTTKYLESLSPSERTDLYLNYTSNRKGNNRNSVLLEKILHQYYDNKWQLLLGDLQLSFLLFLHLGCLSSLTHWRDLLCLLSLEQYPSRDTADSAHNHIMSDLYIALLDTIVIQVQSMEADFFEEVEYSEGNFFIPALERLYKICSCSCLSTINELKVKIKGLITLIIQRFKIDITTCDNEIGAHDSYIHDEDSQSDSSTSAFDIENMENLASEDEKSSYSKIHSSNDTGEILRSDDILLHRLKINRMMLLDDSDEDDDGPMIVPLEEIDEAMARSSEELASQQKYGHSLPPSYSSSLRQSYPLLFSAVTPNEDVLMACARILDEKVDVSLVREAASYLEKEESRSESY